jgi:hypothetical protein
LCRIDVSVRASAEVEDFDAGLRQHDVRRLQIAVHDAVPMRVLERVDDVDRVLKQLLDRQRSGEQALAERLTLDVLHDQEWNAVVFAEVVQRADVRVIHRGERAGLALESLLPCRIRAQVARQDFDGDRPIQTRVDRPVHLAHAAGAERRLNLVGTKTSARDENHGASGL